VAVFRPRVLSLRAYHAMINIHNLTKRYGGRDGGHTAVDGLSLEVARGEFFCFLGPNGAGKTTTIRVLTGLARPTAGTASVGGFDVQREPVRAKALMGYIPDTPFLYERLTGREFMRFVAGLYGLPEDEAARDAGDLLATFGIAEVADDLVEHYSHGMRQKLSFASCFLHRPEAVIVDEPWVGLDPKNIRFVKDFLKEKTAQGTTVFMSTHSLSIVEGVADRIGIIHRGRLLHVGTLEETLRLARRPGTLEDVFLELTGDAES
jgi:ABC-2 type transport system ATP-binding protein